MVCDEHFLERFHTIVIIHHVFYGAKAIRPEKLNFFHILSFNDDLVENSNMDIEVGLHRECSA